MLGRKSYSELRKKEKKISKISYELIDFVCIIDLRDRTVSPTLYTHSLLLTIADLISATADIACLAPASN